MVLGVQIDPLGVVQTRDLLVGVDGCQDAPDISLKKSKKKRDISIII